MSKHIFSTFLVFIIVKNKQSCQANAVEKHNSTNWASWNAWTNCKGQCGETGFTHRYSTKTNDLFKGFNHEWKTCHVLGCTMNNYSKSVEGNTLRMQELDFLKKVSENTILDECFSNFCDYRTLKNVFSNNIIDRFWTALICVKHNLGCPVKGGWSIWSSWSKCTASCGSGVQYRLRYCDSPKPSRASLNCTGESIEFQNCLGKSCAPMTNGTWCKWSKWSQCSVQQGNGIIVRKRYCRHFNNSSYTSCSGPHTEINHCYIPDVDGGWSKWQKWSPCSASCDKGIRHRVRSCSQPEPEALGRGCIGEPVQTSTCHVEPCKGPPVMVATFDKQSYLKYTATEFNNTLLHINVRFYPFDLSGTILRRFYDNCEDCDSIKLILTDFHILLIAILRGHNVTLLSSSTINIGWNDVTLTINKTKITLWLNNNQISKCIKSTTSIINLNQAMKIGEDFEGYIERLSVNFVPYALALNQKFSDMYVPYEIFNTIFELSEEQLHSNLSKSIKVPCPRENNSWKLELYLRFERLSYGNLFLIKSVTMDYMLVEINNDIIKLKIKLDDYFDEKSIKFEEIDSSWIYVEIQQKINSWHINVNGEKHTLIMPVDVPINLCKDYIYIGNSEENQNSTELRGIIGQLKLNNNILNVNDFVVDNSSSIYNLVLHNLSNTLYNEVTITNEEDVIELYCIINDELQYEDLDITWLKSNEPMLHQVNCNISNDCVITTNGLVSTITIFSKGELNDYFYLCTSKKKQKILCVYSVTIFKHVIYTNYIKTFVFFGNLIVIITMLFSIIIIVKIK